MSTRHAARLRARNRSRTSEGLSAACRSSITTSSGWARSAARLTRALRPPRTAETASRSFSSARQLKPGALRELGHDPREVGRACPGWARTDSSSSRVHRRAAPGPRATRREPACLPAAPAETCTAPVRGRRASSSASRLLPMPGSPDDSATRPRRRCASSSAPAIPQLGSGRRRRPAAFSACSGRPRARRPPEFEPRVLAQDRLLELAAAHASARCRAPPPAPLAPPGRRRAPPPGGRHGRGRHQLTAHRSRSGWRDEGLRSATSRPDPARGRPRSAPRSRGEPQFLETRGQNSAWAEGLDKPDRRGAARATGRERLAEGLPSDPRRSPPRPAPGGPRRRAAGSGRGRALPTLELDDVARRARHDDPPSSRAPCAAAQQLPTTTSCRPETRLRSTTRRSTGPSRRPDWRGAEAAPAATAALCPRGAADGRRRSPPTAPGSEIPWPEPSPNVTRIR